ncbi:NADPH--cytochrome P450 reductase [Fusarium oxysporum f. sp. albedinis]|nr:NADPH--cytochrome P450 reductase [Fusarium oxysporum f. sp. albedinis]
MATSKRPMRTFPASRNLCEFQLPSYIRRHRISNDEHDLKATELHNNSILRSEKLLKALEMFWPPRVSNMLKIITEIQTKFNCYHPKGYLLQSCEVMGVLLH